MLTSLSSALNKLALGSVAGAVVLGSFAGSAKADKVLIYQTTNNDPQGGDAAASEANLVFKSLGHDVTLAAGAAPIMPTDLSVFDTVWVIQLPPAAKLR